ncbi:ATP-grasp domain-containing protein [Vibrio sp. WXL210]|uniref:ATP-grasp domain-containing protein n=1 Tax=Vibrio sp. WXL210 TaxID=3450709 RepID=UPI003EC69287
MKNLLVVNPYSSVEHLFGALHQSEVQISVIFSRECYRDSFDVRLADVIFDCIGYSDRMMLNTLKQSGEQFDYILCGTDDSLELTELLTESLLPEFASDKSTLYKRVDKYNQQEALKAAGLPYVPQVEINIDNIDNAIVENLAYPVFAKPRYGHGSIGVFQANNLDELLAGFNKAKGTKIFSVDDYIVQEFIEGEEYFIDSFTVNGEHYICGVCQYRIKNQYFFQSIDVINDPALLQALTGFTAKTLDAIGFHNGFCHTEVFQLADGSFRLIEANPRISGASGTVNKLMEYAYNNSQTQSLVNYLTSEAPLASQSTMANFGSIVMIYNQDSPILNSTDIALLIESAGIESDCESDIDKLDIAKFALYFPKAQRGFDQPMLELMEREYQDYVQKIRAKEARRLDREMALTD